METLIVHTNTKEEMKVVKYIMKALNVKFELSPYKTEFVEKIEKGKRDVENGLSTKIFLDDIWK